MHIPVDLAQRIIPSQNDAIKREPYKVPTLSINTNPADTANAPYLNVYDSNGNKVAEVSTKGYVTSSNKLASKVSSVIGDEPASLTGEALAKVRAERLAAAFSGKVENAKSEESQSKESINTHQNQMNLSYETMLSIIELNKA